MEKGGWQLIALISLAINSVVVALLVYWALAFRSNLGELASNEPVCLAGRARFDSIAAAQMIGRLDLVSMLLTLGGMALAIFAFVGFWVIRREVLDQASKVAAEEARTVAERYYSKDIGRNQAAGDKFSIMDYIGNRLRPKGRQEPATLDPSAISVAGAIEEGNER